MSKLSRTPFYDVWHHMRQRCLNKNSSLYKYYGNREIKIDPKWDSFANFKEDMGSGYKKGLTLDRIDNNKGYSKENCRWATWDQQSKNKRNNVVIQYNGESHVLIDWAKIVGITYKSICGRREKGWNIRQMLETPFKKRKIL